MFDAQTVELIRSAPPLGGLELEDLPKELTRAYSTIVSMREFVNSIWPTSMLSFGPPKRPKSLPTAFLFSVAAAEAEPCAALFAARKGEA
jgi:hypothetical protein